MRVLFHRKRTMDSIAVYETEIIEAINDDVDEESAKPENMDTIKRILPLINPYKLLTSHHESLLKLACSIANIEVINYLSENMDVDKQYNNGKTVLMKILGNPSRDFTQSAIVFPLIKNSKNLNLVNYEGNTALHYAFFDMKINIDDVYDIIDDISPYLDVIDLLLECGADPYIFNTSGHNFISLVMASSQHTTPLLIINMIINHIEKNHVKMHISFLIIAIIYKKYDIVELILPHVVDINEVYKGLNVFQYAERTNDSDIIELLQVSNPNPEHN